MTIKNKRLEKEFWLFTILPNWTHVYLKLARIDKPAGALLLFIPFAWGITLSYIFSQSQYTIVYFLFKVLICFFGSLFMRSTGCIINDIFDRNIDKEVERTKNRPIAKGEVSVKQAVYFIVILLLLSLLVVLQLDYRSIVAALISLPLVVLYPLIKRITNLPQIWLGITFGWSLWVGWFHFSEVINIIPLLLYLSCIVWIISYDTIYAYQDRKDDVRLNVGSLTMILKDQPKYFIMTCYVLHILMLLLIGILMQFNSLFILMLLLSVGCMLRLIFILDINNSEQCWAFFKLNVRYGLFIWFAIFLQIS